MQLKNISLILVTLDVFHPDILGKYFKDLHSLNIKLISLTLLVFHLPISLIESMVKAKQQRNIPCIFVTFLVFQSDIPGNEVNETQ